MRSRGRSPLLYSLALVAVGVAYLGDPTSDQHRPLLPSTPLAPRPLLAESGPSCPLPVGRQLKAVKAFGEMMPVFRHTRCINCHGGVNPRTPKHKGFDQLDPELDPLANREEYEAQCQHCHDELPGWRTPGDPVFFTGKSDEELCLQMKRFENTGDKFVEHIHDDHGGIQFIAAGFAGDRALGAQGLHDHDLVAEKPPGTQVELTEKARKWVAAMGGEYVGDPECGCVKPKIRLEIQHRSEDDTHDASSAAGMVDFAGDVKFEVTLAQVEGMPEGWLKADTLLHRPMTVDMANRNCQGTASREEAWQLFGVLDEEAEKLELQFSVYPGDARGSARCNIKGHIFEMELEPSLFSELEEITIPLEAATQVATAQDPYSRAQERIAVRLVEPE